MFGRLKDWRRIATRYDRCPTAFFSAICLAATVMFWLWVLSLGITGERAVIYDKTHASSRTLDVLRSSRHDRLPMYERKLADS